MKTYKVRIIFKDGEIEVREYNTLRKAEKCIEIYSKYEECEHVHFVED